MNMKSLEGTELVLRISGEVQQSNLAEFEEQALAVIGAINTNLETDDDFAEAEANIKSCQLIENRISTSLSTALASIEAISKQIKTTERVKEKLRETRLLLKNKVVTEKERRKGEVMNAARKRLIDRLESSPAKHGFAIDHAAITNSAKNRRSLKNLEESVNQVIDSEIIRLVALEVTFEGNLAAIERAEAEWPGLFPDRQNIALSAPETVEAMIVGRVADHRMRVAEKARREAEEAERRARLEAERKAAIAESERIAMESEHLAKIAPDASGQIIDEPRDFVPVPEPFVDFPIPPSLVARYALDVSVITDEIRVVIETIRAIPGVGSVEIRNNKE